MCLLSSPAQLEGTGGGIGEGELRKSDRHFLPIAATITARAADFHGKIQTSMTFGASRMAWELLRSLSVIPHS
jgi:hypothetical protein